MSSSSASWMMRGNCGWSVGSPPMARKIGWSDRFKNAITFPTSPRDMVWARVPFNLSCAKQYAQWRLHAVVKSTLAISSLLRHIGRQPGLPADASVVSEEGNVDRTTCPCPLSQPSELGCDWAGLARFRSADVEVIADPIVDVVEKSVVDRARPVDTARLEFVYHAEQLGDLRDLRLLVFL